MGRDARGTMLRQLALIEPRRIVPTRAIEFPNRVAGRAEWVAVTLHSSDDVSDLFPPGTTGAKAGHRTVLGRAG